MGAMAVTDPREAVIDRILSGQPGPVDDSPGGYERDDWPGQRAADERADEAADRYEKEMDARWT